jgi:predicted nuclease of predicted toxin-antitoxin system
VRLLADLNVAPRTVEFLRSLGHDVVRVAALLPATATDAEIVEAALRENRTILTQDLDFSALVALSGRSRPSVISLRLSSLRVERVNERLRELLPTLAAEIESGAIVSVDDDGVRARSLPIG